MARPNMPRRLRALVAGLAVALFLVVSAVALAAVADGSQDLGGGYMPARLIVDLFAGAGGWDEGLRTLGHRALGVELDPIACESAEAAGHGRLRADLALLDPARFAPVRGLIASPPCQAYSSAGTGAGRFDKAQVIACARELAAGRDTRGRRSRRCRAPGSLLTVEPLRWALALRPRWLAFEQVPAVLELWSLFAELLEPHGYRSAAGLLSAERYGVPQVRRRAFLIASLDGEVSLPEPSHRSHNPRRRHVTEQEARLPEPVGTARALGLPGTGALITNRHGYGERPWQGRRPLSAPSYTVLSSSYEWRIESRAGSGPRAPRRRGSRAPAECRRHEEARRPASNAETRRRPTRSERVRLAPAQAAVLQGFRHDHPFRGSRAARFLQIANAVPPPLGAAVLREAMRPSERGRGPSPAGAGRGRRA
jgi:DNA (cytosine-5)-methyltransferase 1